MSIETEKVLNEVMDEIFDDMLDIMGYAGNAYCSEKEEESAKFFKGQYIALKRTRENVRKRMYGLQIEREKGE